MLANVACFSIPIQSLDLCVVRRFRQKVSAKFIILLSGAKM